jgi:hypothetical protein
LSNFCSAQTALAAGTIEIVNGTRMAMVSLQLKGANASSWHPNVLRDGPLGVQKQTTVPAPEACVCDLKATFEDGHRTTRPHINLCRSPKYVMLDF